LVGTDAAFLSTGGQQQLAIGRAMVMRPRLLLMDEPTEGIQPSIIRDIADAIRFLRERWGMAVVLVEQYLDFARGWPTASPTWSAGGSCSAAAARRWPGPTCGGG
jgi:urea transport system ATP-binding protein